MNCWEYKNCGREAGGANSAEFGVCPAYAKGAGDACWIVSGTFCGGVVQGTFAQKQRSCMTCEFYGKFDMAHRTAVRSKYGVA